MRTAWIAVVSAFWASTAWGLALPIVEVSAPDINCVFDLDCTIVVNDSTAELVLPGGVGVGFLQSRTFPAEDGTQAEGLFGYEYRIDVRNIDGILFVPCVTSLSIDFGTAVSLDYDGDDSIERVFVVTEGGLGSVGPSSADKQGNTITFEFAGGVCAGETSYFFGMASSREPKFISVEIQELQTGETVELEARAPALPPGGCAPRPDLVDDFTAGERTLLANLQQQQITEATIDLHLTSPGIHGTSLFLPWHREYIGDLENFLIGQGHPEFVPLPKYDPAKPIPAEHTVVDADCAGCAALADTTPNKPLPANLQKPDICPNYDDAEALRLGPPAPGLESYHNSVHVAVGGVMVTFSSPGSVIFLPWHSFVDDVWKSWQCCPSIGLIAFPIDTLIRRACLFEPCWPIWFGLDDPLIRDPSKLTISDRRGENNLGTLVGNPVPIPGLVGGAYHFPGDGSHIRVADHPELAIGTSDLSIDAWIRTTAEGLQPIVTKMNSAGAGYALFVVDGHLGLHLADAQVAPRCGFPNDRDLLGDDFRLPCDFVSATNELDDGEWHHVAASVDRDGTSRLYVDSQPVLLFDVQHIKGEISCGADLLIGAKRGRNGNENEFQEDAFLRGDIDELDLFRFALSEDEVDGIFSAGAGGKYGSHAGIAPVVEGPCLDDLRQLIVNLEAVTGRNNNSLLVKIDKVLERLGRDDAPGAQRMLSALRNQARGLANNERYERGVYETIEFKAEQCLTELDETPVQADETVVLANEMLVQVNDCGLGAELAFVVPLLMWFSRRRRVNT